MTALCPPQHLALKSLKASKSERLTLRSKGRCAIKPRSVSELELEALAKSRFTIEDYFMSIVCKQWVELRELPGSENSEIFYIRLHNIERISFIEASSHEIKILIYALGEKYLYTTVETLQEAQLASKGLMQDIENAKSKTQ